MAILNTASLTSKFNNLAGEEISVTNKSNTHRANNLTTDLSIEKTASKNWALPQDVLTITTLITNNSDLTINSINFKDTLTGATVVAGSLKIGEEPHTNYDPIAGFEAEVVLDGLGESVPISYQIMVDQYPEVNSVKNTTTIGVSFDSRQFNLKSNEVQIDILDNEIWLNKSASKAVISGDELTYTIVISNSGSFKNTNLVFSDPIPSGTTFVEGSVTVDGVAQPTYNPNDGFNIGDLDINGEITVTFKVRVE